MTTDSTHADSEAIPIVFYSHNETTPEEERKIQAQFEDIYCKAMRALSQNMNALAADTFAVDHPCIFIVLDTVDAFAQTLAQALGINAGVDRAGTILGYVTIAHLRDVFENIFETGLRTKPSETPAVLFKDLKHKDVMFVTLGHVAISPLVNTNEQELLTVVIPTANEKPS